MGFPALLQFTNCTISHSIQLGIENGQWRWKLGSIYFISSEENISKISSQVVWIQAKSYSFSCPFEWDWQNRTADFISSLQFTQNELDNDFYTVLNLRMSSFKFRKWHSISTFVQKVMFNQRYTIQAFGWPFPDFLQFRKF